jgi:thioredoxin 1
VTAIYIISGIVILFVSMQILIRLQSKSKRGKDLKEVGGYIGDIIRQGGRVILYFYSPTCGACRQQTPVIDNLKNKSSKIHKIDISKDINAAMAIGVMGTPSTVIIENGLIKEFFLGYVGREKLLNYI